MSGQHAFLAPSGAERWGPGGCAAAPTMEATFPEDMESEESREGTACHDYAAGAILTGHVLKVGEPASNGYPITAAMPAESEEYISDCLADRAAGADCYVEQRVYAHAAIHPLCDGTPDHFAIWPAEKRLKLKDFKYGHRYVDEFRNLQLAVYLIAIFETMKLGSYEGWTIEAQIYQPRNYHPAGHVRTWRVTAAELEWLRAELQAAALVASTPGAPCTTGPHCKDCSAAYGCTTLQNSTSAIVDMTGKQWPHAPNNDVLGKELTMLRAAQNRLKARVEALEEQAINRIAQGQRVAGWTGEHSYGREIFTVPPEKVVAWCNVFGVDAAAPLATRTPAQLRKAGVPAEHMKAITDKPRGAYTLVQVTPHSLAKGMSNGN